MRTRAVGVALLMAFVAGASIAQTTLDVPMDRSLVSVLIVFGVEDKEPTVWEGTYEVTGGQIVATDGWRFLGDDYATTSAFKFQNQRRYPLMWNRSGRDPDTFPVEPNGVILTLAGVGPDSVLQLRTTQGDFSIPVGALEYSDPKRTGEGRIEYQRVPTHRQIVKAPTEDGYPAVAVDGQGRVWVFWSANVDGNWDLYARVRTDGTWSDAQRVTTAPGSDFDAAATTDSQGRVWLTWQSLGGKGSDIQAARQEGDSLGKPMSVADSDANEWSPAIAASADGRVAVAWDTYARGSYDVAVKEWREGKWGEERLVAGTLQNECRASVASDKQNRLWIAYEVSPEGWGKDFGPYDQSPQKTALYQSR